MLLELVILGVFYVEYWLLYGYSTCRLSLLIWVSFMLSIDFSMAIQNHVYAECRLLYYDEWRYAKCRYAECHGACYIIMNRNIF